MLVYLSIHGQPDMLSPKRDKGRFSTSAGQPYPKGSKLKPKEIYARIN